MFYNLWPNFKFCRIKNSSSIQKSYLGASICRICTYNVYNVVKTSGLG